MRSYHIAAAAFAAKCSEKWVDNLLSHHCIAGVEHARQGVTREISSEALLQIVLIRVFVDTLDIPVRRAIELAAAMDSDPQGRVVVSPDITLAADLARIRTRAERRLLDAVESVVPATRGRPKGSRGGRGEGGGSIRSSP